MKNVSEPKQNKGGVFSSWKKGMVLALTLAVCCCLTGVTVLAATGKLQGFFKDKTNWTGAVTGTTYEQATEELEVTAGMKEGKLVVSVTLLEPDKPPYSEIEEWELGKFQILDAAGTVMLEDEGSEVQTAENGQIVFLLPAEQLEKGTYRMVITSFVGSKKADQPLPVKGNWMCEFEY